MEYSPVEGKGISIVKFFAYAGGTKIQKECCPPISTDTASSSFPSYA